MLTPADKLKSGVNDIIQIIVTTSCDLFTCSNCTQLLPYRQDARHMSLGSFLKAVKSLADWPGVVALFGGNPCTHPQFPELCRILEDHIQPQSRRGLWSNNLMGHGAVVRRTFYPDGRFNLNVHRNIEAAVEMGEWVPGKIIKSSVREHSWHSPILMSHHDLGLSYRAWRILRESCDINQKWSGAIVERDGQPRAYFCEVAAALDGVRGDNHGVPLFPHWWEAPITHFQHQIQGCCDQGCGVPLRRKGHQDHEAIYDITESFIPYTSLRSKSVTVTLHDSTTGEEMSEVPEMTDYLRTRT